MATRKVIIEFELDKVIGYEWLFYPLGGDDSEVVTDENVEEASVALKASPELVKAIHSSLQFLAETIIDATKADMRDLWDKIEKLERTINEI